MIRYLFLLLITVFSPCISSAARYSYLFTHTATGARTLISIDLNDITHAPATAIVNAANQTLIGSAGVAYAIQQAAGPQLLSYIRALPITATGIRCEVGQSIVTPSFLLSDRAIQTIIHTVGPDCRVAEQAAHAEQLLRSAYMSALQCCAQEGLKSIAFPAISTGIFGYPIDQACTIAIESVLQWLIEHPGRVSDVYFSIFATNVPAYQAALEQAVKQAQGAVNYRFEHVRVS